MEKGLSSWTPSIEKINISECTFTSPYSKRSEKSQVTVPILVWELNESFTCKIHLTILGSKGKWQMGDCAFKERTEGNTKVTSLILKERGEEKEYITVELFKCEWPKGKKYP